MSRVFRIGTRASKLARIQAGMVADTVKAPWVECLIATAGDRTGTPIAGDGIFVTEVRAALVAGEIDIAVHSLKDLPTEPFAGTIVAAVPERADPRDFLVGATLDGLKVGARVGTSSPRRAAQLLALRGDVHVVPLRGNVPTRVRKVIDGELDAAIVAKAGLDRLGIAPRGEPLDLGAMLPAPGQGALAVEVRADDEEARDLVAPLEHAPSRVGVEAERALLRLLGGGCLIPLGAVATVPGGTLWLRACLSSTNGLHQARASASGPDAAEQVAQALRAMESSDA